MPWTINVHLLQVNEIFDHSTPSGSSATVSGATLYLNLRTTSGVEKGSVGLPLNDARYATTLADESIKVDIRIKHPRYSDALVSLVRAQSASTWDWTGSASKVSQSGSALAIDAMLLRTRPAPFRSLSLSDEGKLVEQAKEAKIRQKEKWSGSGKKKDPPWGVDIDQPSAILLEPDKQPVGMSFHDYPPDSLLLHIVQPDVLGDPSKPGWGRFSTLTRVADPAKTGHEVFFEFGEVSSMASSVPKFLIASWIPFRLMNRRISSEDKIDFVIWFTPTPREDRYPIDRYPFVTTYPYEVSGYVWYLGALGIQDLSNPQYGVSQQYVRLPLYHLFQGQHLLAHLMTAAGRSACIVIPICPAASKFQFEAFLSQSGLMRLLRESCARIALLRQDKPGQHPGPPPEVGRVVLAGFSAGVPRLARVISQTSTLDPYSGPDWGSDSKAFRDHWKEIWSFDAAYLDWKNPRTKVIVTGKQQFSEFLNSCADWVTQNDDRKLRIYKTDFSSGGRWDPRSEHDGSFQKLVRKSGTKPQTSTSPWAISIHDSNRRWQCVSLSEEYIRDPERDTGLPLLPEGTHHGAYHEVVPEVFFGHAVITSDLA